MVEEKRPEPGKKSALLLTVLVHGALIAALFLGVQWKRSQTEALEVELWSPPVAVTPPPPPVVKPKPEPPKVEPEAPKKPDIVVKEEPKPKKPEPVEKKPPPPPPISFKEQLAREERQAQARLDAQIEAEQRATASQRALANDQISYAGKIRGKIRGNIVLPPGIAGNPEAMFAVTQLPTGEVLAVSLKRSSGNAALDAAIERAILKSSPLPKPDNPAVFYRELEIKYWPFEE
ncbi:MAG: TonB C-terminal domain-containing protein [Betaproteobacteria bacterium]|nr:TonB C-terminal domain-containing protein [Betaproteobacteria bacterium]MCL2885561.1 TonB C-terminal domain-containing protein [Betaproteobacteria bacterium]